MRTIDEVRFDPETGPRLEACMKEAGHPTAYAGRAADGGWSIRWPWDEDSPPPSVMWRAWRTVGMVGCCEQCYTETLPPCGVAEQEQRRQACGAGDCPHGNEPGQPMGMSS